MQDKIIGGGRREREMVVTEEMMLSWALKYLYHNGFCWRTQSLRLRRAESVEQHWAAFTSRKNTHFSSDTVSHLLHPQMSVSDSSPSSICMFTLHHPSSSSPDGTLPLDSDSGGQMPQMDGGLYGQQMGFPKMPDNRSMEQMMGLGYLPYPSCLSGTNAERGAQQSHGAPQVTDIWHAFWHWGSCD